MAEESRPCLMREASLDESKVTRKIMWKNVFHISIMILLGRGTPGQLHTP